MAFLLIKKAPKITTSGTRCLFWELFHSQCNAAAKRAVFSFVGNRCAKEQYALPVCTEIASSLTQARLDTEK